MDSSYSPLQHDTHQATTIGQLADRLIYDWAEAADVAGPLALLAAAMRVRTRTQVVLFRGILDALDPVASILTSWELHGSQTFGTARLAAAWRRRPQYLDTLAPRRIGVGNSTDADFEVDVREGLLSNRHDALFFLMGRPYPTGRGEAVHRTMRAWALLHGLRLFALSPKPDKLLYRACRTLGHAALESERHTWGELLQRIGAHADRWEQVDERLIVLVESKEKARLPVHRDFVSAAYQLAKFGSDPYDDRWAEPSSQVLATAWAQLVQSNTPAAEVSLEPSEPSAFSLPVPNWPAEEIGEDNLDIQGFDSDPGQTTDEQAQAVQTVRFQLGAAARFLPWDWHQLVPPEREALSARIISALTAPTHAAERNLAAIATVALAAGLSIDEVAAVPLDSSLSATSDWWLDLDSACLVRIPPRHATHWKVTSKTAYLVRSAAQKLRFPLQDAAVAALRDMKQHRAAATMLVHLWFEPGVSLQTAFRSWFRQDPSTSRIQPSMLAKLLGQTSYESSNDAVLARLLVSNRVAPLPSATVYTAYEVNQLVAAVPDTEAGPLQADRAPLNVAGSLLESQDNDLVESSFAELLDDMRRHQARGDVIQFHNAVALYWDATLRAATGVRPVSGLWLSTSQFDWDQCAVYIDDKASPVAHTGRLVPLPVDLCANFKSQYVERHLPWIVSQLEAKDSLGSEPLPALLFILEDVYGPPDLVAIENKHRKLKDTNLIEGRLPLNLFRHRLRTLLHREAGVDLEVVDTVMGHGDGATLTHGNFSMRAWRPDADAIRPALTRIFEALHIRLPPLWTNAVAAVPGRALVWEIDRIVDGPAAVEQKSAAQRELSDSAIRRFVIESKSVLAAATTPDPADRNGAAATPESLPALVASLSEEQLDDLSRRLLADERGMPSASGAIRYERLLELAGMAWDQLGLRAPFGKRYCAREIEPSPFNPLSPRANALMQALRDCLEEMFEVAGERSRIKLNRALALVVFDLALISRITNEGLLQSVVEDDRQWRVVRLHDEFFLEWSPSDDLEQRPTAPIQRFAISLRSAWLLHHVVRGKTRRMRSWQSSHEYALALSLICSEVFGAAQVADSGGLLTAVLSTVDQANALELPGSAAGFLAGRVWTASLGWGDWLRLRTGRWLDTTQVGTPDCIARGAPWDEKAVRLEKLPDDSDHEFDIVAETRFLDADELGHQRAQAAMSRSDAAFSLIASVRKQLRRLTGAEDGSKHRARAAEVLSREVHHGAASVSSAIQLLCLWAVDLLLRPGRSRKLATSSVIRYFGALSPRFQSMAYEVDLGAMEDVEIEAFYASVLSGAKVDNLKDTYDGLWNFHKFAQMACGLSDIDWSVLAVSERIRLGSPGFIDELSYQELLKRLGDDHGLPDIASWQLQCVAFLAFRFGLRGGEATGLRRSDLHLDGPQPYLIVQNNRMRDLKSRASRRVVPLMFDITPMESSILAKLRDFHTIDGVGLVDAPAFARIDNPGQAVDGYKMRAAINRHLKEITGQASSSMHKLRKAFVIRLWRSIEAPHYCASSLPLETETARQRIRFTMLGPCRDCVSRRGAWAVARVTGHSHPQTTLRAYAHILSDVAHESVAIKHLAASLGLRPELVKVPALETLFGEVRPVERTKRGVAPTASPVDTLRALLFLSRGRSTSEAAEFSNVPIPRVERLSAITDRIHKRLLDADPGHLQRHADNPQSRRLARRGILSLLHINAHARLRTGLMTMAADSVQRLSAIESIEAPEWEAMVGGRREISMWLPHHFELTAVAARHFLTTGSRPKLLSPRAMTSVDSARRLTEMAVEAGWLPRADAMLTADGAAPLCSSVEAVGGLPRVRCADKGFTIDDRLVLRLTGIDANDRVCDGLELAVALACLNTFASIEFE